MNRTELLEFMKPRITTFYYDILEVWSRNREKSFWGMTKFDIQPSLIRKGYYIWDGYDLLAVYC
jgi:hypothetical protein